MSFLLQLYIHVKFRVFQIFRLLTINTKTSIYTLLFGLLIVLIKLPSDYFLLVITLFVVIFHINRKDINFLNKVFFNKWKYIVLLENLIIFGTLSLINVNYKYEYKILLGILFILFLSFFIKSFTRRLIYKWSILPNSIFEWRSYLRENTILIILIYPLFIASSYNKYSLILGALFVMDPIIHVFKHNENKEMLQLYFSKFDIKEKLKFNTIFFNIVLFPSYIVFLMLNFNFYYLIFYYIIFMNLFHLLIITRKYELYMHTKKRSSYLYIETYYENMFLAILIIPAILEIKGRIKSGTDIIKSYVGN